VESYDDVPYPGAPFAQTRPERLAAAALLFGLEPAPPEGCRVLELGCGDGENLVPMALALPGARFVGIDLAASAIAQGCDMARRLGVTNVDLRHGDLMEISAAWGDFDYVIAHGLWSWVPDFVRTRIFEVLRERLTPNGVAFVSYDVYPGGRLRELTRDLMAWHGRGAKSDADRIARAREILPLLAAAGGPSSAYHAVLRSEAESQSRRPDGAVFHDDLAENHLVVPFHAFAARAAEHGLQYLAEAEFAAMNLGRVPKDLRSRLPELAPTRIEREQYMDFAQGRYFRQTLLCRADAKIAEEPSAERVHRLHAATSGRAEGDEDELRSDRTVRFALLKDANVEIWHPVAKLAIAELTRAWPASMAVSELLERVRERRGVAAADDGKAVTETLLALHGAAAVELLAAPWRVRSTVSERPRTSALVRLQIREGRFVTSLRHERLEIADALSAALLARLDGSRDHAALVDELAAVVARGEAPSPIASADPAALRASLTADLPTILGHLAERSLLEA
jgi:methyltransferase-like protein/protein-L-isoaspartate O-methyltransferase